MNNNNFLAKFTKYKYSICALVMIHGPRYFTETKLYTNIFFKEEL